MTGHRKWSEARESRRPREGDVAQISPRADLQKKLSDHAKSLGDLRRARQMTQRQLAKVMQVSQAQVSRVENQADLYLSTLRSYIEAMGGELQIRVAFPGTSWSEVTIGDVTAAEAQSAEAEGESYGAPDFLVHPHAHTEESLDASGIVKIWLNNERNAITYSDFRTNLNRLWVVRSDLRASSSACGFIAPEPEGERSALEQGFSWRTTADPFIPTDSESFVSSAEFKEK
jgi:transcriptional regulator with XRE-family HTH domain